MTDSGDPPSERLPEMVVERVPELQDALERESEFWAEYGMRQLGPDAIFSLVLAPYVIARLDRCEEGRDEVLQRIFTFLEELASSEQDVVLSAVYVSFGEELLANPAAFHKARKYLGTRLRQGLDDMEARRRDLPRQFL